MSTEQNMAWAALVIDLEEVPPKDQPPKDERRCTDNHEWIVEVILITGYGRGFLA